MTTPPGVSPFAPEIYSSRCALPETVVSIDGENAERLIPKIRSVYGDYHPWPGPNSNTFVQAALDAVPELNAVLPPTAIGKDYPYDGGMVRLHAVPNWNFP